MPELPSPSLPEMQNTPEQNTVPNPALTTTTIPLSTPHHNKHMVFIAGATCVAIGAIIGLSYAAWSGYLPNPLTERPTAEKLIASLEALQSAKTTTTLRFALEPQSNNVTPLDFSLFQSNEAGETDSTTSSPGRNPLMFIDMLPSDLELNLNIDSSFTKTTETAANETTRFTGTYTGNNITANLDLSTRTIDGTTYIKPDAIPLPIPIFDLNTLKGKWINLSKKEDGRNVFEETNRITSENTNKNTEEEKPNVLNELFVLIEQGVKDGAIIFSVPERSTYNGERVWKTEAVIDGEKLRDTIISIGKNQETLFPNQKKFTIFDTDFLLSISKERAKDIFRELFARTTFSALINDESNPISLSFSTSIAPKLEDDALKNRQVTLEATINFTHLNETITVETPENALSVSEAGALLMRKTLESVRIDDQKNTIEDLREALEIYAQEHGTYPEELNDLLGLEGRLKKVVNIPLDIITEKPYVYEKTDTGYKLQYEMPESENEVFSDFGKSKIVTGTNTATDKLFSEEGAKITDNDNDGIYEYDEEMLYGTSDQMDDTDSDGYDDKTEIDGGYNPNGEGALIQ